MLDFEVFYKKHGENFIWDILNQWERDFRVQHPRPMSLEERWEHFINATNDHQAVDCSAVAPAATV